ncbi:MAG: DUF4870 domain-containing protein [Blastochloris sp.]|nr:DUF4870 domain-containing protein [Blastochloris sp.]
MTTPSDSDTKLWNMLCHLSALAGFVIPFGNIVGPLIVWQIKKNEIPSVDAHGKESLNFQITAMIILLPLFVIAFLLSFIVIGVLLFPVIGLLGLAVLGLSIYAGIQANNGVEYKYPFNFRLIK